MSRQTLVFCFMSILLVLSLVACGGAPATEPAGSTSEEAEAPAQATEAEEEMAAEEEAPAEEEMAAEEASGEPIRIGVIAGLTGDSAIVGVPFVAAAELAAEQINAQGGINGRPVELIIEDNETRPQAGVEAALKLVDVDEVDILVCSCFTVVFFPVVEALVDKDIVIFNGGGATTPQVRELPGHVISPAPLDDVLGVALATLAWDLGFESGALLTVNDPYGLTFREETMGKFEELGGEVTLDILVEGGLPDYRPELQRIASADPEMLLVGTYTSDARLQFRQLTDLGWEGPWFKLYPTITEFELLPEAHGRVYGIENMWLRDEATEWRDAYQEATGNPPDWWASLGNDNLWLAALGVANAEDSSADSVLAAVLDSAGGYDGVAAREYAFDEDRVNTSPNLLPMELSEDGEWVEMEP